MIPKEPPGPGPATTAPASATTPAPAPAAAAGPRVRSGAALSSDSLALKRADPPPFELPSWRPIVVVTVLFLLVAGLGYPLAVDGFERVTGAFAPNGAFLPGGAPAGLAANGIGENITNASLFWLRPSQTDYNTTVSSGDSPYGPTDPNLVNLTEYYIALYGLNNTTVPLDLVGNSESGIDPDLTPAAALVQVPRVAANNALTQAYLTTFVMDHVTQPYFGFIGPAYVNVILLDTDLVSLLAHRGGAS